MADGTLDVIARPAKASPKARPRPNLRKEVGLEGRDATFLGYYPQGTQLVGATFDYIAGPTKPIVGVVRLKGSGKPVEGAIVRGADPGTHTAVTARTDAEGRFRLDGVPKGDYYQIKLDPRPGIDPFFRHAEIIDDTEGLKPIEASVEVSPGVIVTGRLVDKATGRVIPPADVEYNKAPDNLATGSALAFSRLADGAFGLTVPPGRGMIAGAAAAEGKDDPYVGASLKAADRKQESDEKFYKFKTVGYHTYRFIDIPADSGPVAVDLELTRGLSRAGRLTDPDGRPVVGARAYGLSARDWSGTGRSQPLDAETFEVGGRGVWPSSALGLHAWGPQARRCGRARGGRPEIQHAAGGQARPLGRDQRAAPRRRRPSVGGGQARCHDVRPGPPPGLRMFLR